MSAVAILSTHPIRAILIAQDGDGFVMQMRERHRIVSTSRVMPLEAARCSAFELAASIGLPVMLASRAGREQPLRPWTIGDAA